MGLSLRFFTFMYLVSSLLFLLSLSFSHSTSSVLPLCHDHERSALLKFKESLFINQAASGNIYAYPKVASWNLGEENSNCCSWDGIKCDEDAGHVIMLNLTSCCLYGSINSGSSLFHLVHLEWLSLSDNHFNFSVIPSEIVYLSNLRYLYLSKSMFSGQIPAELLELSRLEVLDLSLNNYYMKLQKPGLANLAEKLTNLKALDLVDVNISSIVPPTLANLFSLTYLSLSESFLQGEFPAEIFQLPNLQFLGLMYNPNLTGYLPEFQKSSPLEVLRISFSGFSGKIPYSIENLKSLSVLDMQGDYFSGKIPPSIGNLTKLTHLLLAGYSFSGELPSSIGNLVSLETLHISSCNFSGELPVSLGNLTQLTSLSLYNNSFFSSLYPYSISWIAHLKKLTYLDLSNCKLVGEIPSVLRNLTQLTELDLSFNNLTGPIPYWLMNLNKLSSLTIRRAQLSGHIPVEIRNLTQLQYLYFGANKLEGSVPSSIFELENLRGLELAYNNLSGTLDLNNFILNMKSLEMLVLSSNNLSLLTRPTVNTYSQKFLVIGLRSCNLSEFPFFLYNQDELKSLDLSSNNIAGQVPQWFFNVSPNLLEYLNLSCNSLTGFEQEHFILPWSVMNTLDLSFNKLQGPFPIPSASTQVYLVSNNQLTGEIPTLICSLSGLYAFDLSHNNLSGMLPECLGNFSAGLSVLKLQGNNFHGIIPQTFVNGTNVRMIDFSSNSLQGRVPKSLANCVKLKFLNLGQNQITDIFPSWLGNLPELEILVLKSNNFHGEIEEPTACFQFLKLRIIDLSHNKFTGNLPSKYFECWNAMRDDNASKLTYLRETLLHSFPGYPVLTYYGFSDYSLTLSNKGTDLEYEKLSNLITAIILSNNSFVGEIPTSIANLKGLRNLNLSGNNLEGGIPSSLGNLKVLESLDLSANKLSGQIPQQLGEITTLEVFDVSHNQLTGPIPKGKQFNTFGNASFAGNTGLCGEPLLKRCENSEESSDKDQSSESFFAFGWKPVLIGYAGGTIIGVLLGHIFSARAYEWLAKTFRLPPKSNRTRKRQRQRM